MTFPSILVAEKDHLIEVDSLAFEMREQILSPEGDILYDSDYWEPNALTNDGQAHMLNVWAREQSNLNKWLMLLNMPGGAAPTKTSTLATITEAEVINTDGYIRTQVAAGDWGVPALDSGDQQITASQKTFGPASGGGWPVSHVALASVGSTFTGTLFLYVSTAYHTANSTSRVFVSGESYLVTLRDKQV